jgi:BON domain
VASQVEGVVAIDNNLTVQPQSWAVQSDDETEKDIEQRLQWSAFVDESDVEVAVNDGVATLSGTVGSLAEEEAAIFIARKAGARFVRDELVVRNPFSQAEGTEPRGYQLDRLHTSAAARYYLRRCSMVKIFFSPMANSNLPCPNAYDRRAFIP